MTNAIESEKCPSCETAVYEAEGFPAGGFTYLHPPYTYHAILVLFLTRFFVSRLSVIY